MLSGPVQGVAVASGSNSSTHSILSAVNKQSYVAPYDITKPLDYIIIHNRSKHAANSAIRELKLAWPDLRIIHVVQEKDRFIPTADEVLVIDKDKWTDMAHFKERFNQLLGEKPEIKASFDAKRAGFYCVWSAAAENEEWARKAQKEGFVWIGANPNTMEGLDKVSYKKLCRRLRTETAKFVEIKAPKERTAPKKARDKEKAFRLMAEKLVKLYSKSELKGKDIFVKHSEGGGGRGSLKVSKNKNGKISFDTALAAIQKVVNETGGNLEGVYMEEALDLEGAQLFQIEIESDGPNLAPGARLVWFNKENQKVLELGFTDEEIIKIIPKEVYERCRADSERLFRTSGYSSRGTNEILIIKDRHGNWLHKNSELNKRIQVEHEAISELVTDLKGRPKNVPAEQVMRSLGYPSPTLADYKWKDGAAIVAHIRILSCEVTAKGSKYFNNSSVERVLHPDWVEVLLAKGLICLDADPQLGRMLVKANSWQEFCDKLLVISREVQLFGLKTEESNYFEFLGKLASDPDFRAQKLGCNQTLNVLSNPPVAKSELQKAHQFLTATVNKVVVEGYRPGEGIDKNLYPTEQELEQFRKFKSELAQVRADKLPETPFSRYLVHKDQQQYIAERKLQLAKHGGGTVTVFPRDVQQSAGDQESAALQKYSVELAETFGVLTDIFHGYETGGAQYQAGLMKGFDWWEVLLAGLPANLISHSLTRSKWMNGLEPKTREEQAFIFKTIAKAVKDKLGFSKAWKLYNFHAGNHPEQDITTREALRAGLGAIPCWVFDPRFTEEDFKGWIKRQIELFKSENEPLSEIRIKNPGQGPEWKPEIIVAMVDTIRALFKGAGLDEPIIQIHNHDLDGKAGLIAAAALKECQARGYRYLVVDSAPPYVLNPSETQRTTHNSNLVIAEALEMSAQEREALNKYNEGAQAALNLNKRFNNSKLADKIQGLSQSEMAAGTVSSDIADALKQGIPVDQIEILKARARELTNLGAPVTPYSEWIKQIGIAIYLNKDIQPKTVEAASTYIAGGGTLAISTAILEGLRQWKTLLKRPPVIEKLLQNHGISLEVEEKQEPSLDLEARRRKLKELLPHTEIDDKVLATWTAFGNIGLEYLKNVDHWIAANGPQKMHLLMSDPDFIYSNKKKVGDSFDFEGRKITIAAIEEDKGYISVGYEDQGKILGPFIEVDPREKEKSPLIQAKKVTDANTQVGAPLAGILVGFKVKKGDIVKKGQVLAAIEVMKMEHIIRAPFDLMVEEVADIPPNNRGQLMVEPQQLMVTFKEFKPAEENKVEQVQECAQESAQESTQEGKVETAEEISATEMAHRFFMMRPELAKGRIDSKKSPAIHAGSVGKSQRSSPKLFDGRGSHSLRANLSQAENPQVPAVKGMKLGGSREEF